MNPRISVGKIPPSHFESDPNPKKTTTGPLIKSSLTCLCLNSTIAGTVGRSSAIPAQIMSCRSPLHPNPWESATPATLCSSSAAPPMPRKMAKINFNSDCAVQHRQSDQNRCTCLKFTFHIGLLPQRRLDGTCADGQCSVCHRACNERKWVYKWISDSECLHLGCK